MLLPYSVHRGRSFLLYLGPQMPKEQRQNGPGLRTWVQIRNFKKQEASIRLMIIRTPDDYT